MANIGAAKSRKFAIGTSELRIGPLNMAGRLTQDYTVGLVDTAVLTVEQTVVDLKGGFPQTIMDSAVTDQSAQITATCREFSRRNLGIMLNQGLAYASDNDTNDAKTTIATNGIIGKTIDITAASGNGSVATATFATQPKAPFPVGSTVIISGMNTTGFNTGASGAVVTACTTTSVSYSCETNGAASGTMGVVYAEKGIYTFTINSSTGFTGYAAASWDGWVSVYDPSSLGVACLTRITDITTNKVTLDPAFPLPHNLFSAGSVVAKLAPVIVGNVTSVPYFTAQLVTLDRASGRPRIANFWKVANGSGLNLSQGATDFATTEMVLKVIQPSIVDYASATSPLYAIRDLVTKYPMGIMGEVSDDTAGY